MRSTFSVLSYISRGKIRADGTTAVMCINRKKTGVEAFIPLHPISAQILFLYNTTDMHSPVFPLPDRDSIWHEIREIGMILKKLLQ